VANAISSDVTHNLTQKHIILLVSASLYIHFAMHSVQSTGKVIRFIANVSWKEGITAWTKAKSHRHSYMAWQAIEGYILF